MKTWRQTNIICLLSIGLAIILLLMSSIMMMVVIPVNAFMPKVHSDINNKILSFLKPDILSKINSGDEGADKNAEFGHREYHSIGCDFQGTTENINRLYDQIVSNIDEKATMAETFGLLLHPVQDFYSHSNWIELGRNDLVESSSDNKWPVLKPFQEYKGVIIVQGEDEDDDEDDNKDDIHMDYTLSRTGKVVYVSSQSYENRPGLISTVYGNKNYCPEDIALDHDTLNKDIPDRDGYPQARALAVAQTIHEWCRLLNLVELNDGQAGVQLIFDSWVEDKEKANSVCR